jgi:urocanate hydratase
MTDKEFKRQVAEGIPKSIPPAKPYDRDVNHAPRRKDILGPDEKRLALRNALRYFPAEQHEILAPEFARELAEYGRIYMYRYRPDYKIYARDIDAYPHRSRQAAAIMVMLSNNLDEAVAQHPHELITYGGNGAVFQNWAQYRISMQYLAEMTDQMTLVLYSGHPLGLFPSSPGAPRVVVTNGMVVPNYSSPDDYERLNALGVSQYGQMTAGSFMYIGPQGIVHGTAITVLNAGRMKSGREEADLGGQVFVTSGLGGMSGAQPRATEIAGGICLVAEVNPKALKARYDQGWVSEVHTDLDKMLIRMEMARRAKESTSLAYHGNIVDLWEKLVREDAGIELGSDQTSLHNPYAGGYYPEGISFEEANAMMVKDPGEFKNRVQESLRRQVEAINTMAGRGMYFWDYGNAFLLEAGRAGAEVFRNGTGRSKGAAAFTPDGSGGLLPEGSIYRYPSYVEDIMGPLFFDYGFGPFRWVCTSSKDEDLEVTDAIASRILEAMSNNAPSRIRSQLLDNLRWIREAGKNNLVVGSKARILYADAEGRVKIGRAFNDAIREKKISAPVVLGRDHHDVSGTDSPYRETSNIYDGSRFTADMAVQNVIGDAFRGATWVSIHNGGGVGWGEVINGGFGMVLDGSLEAERRLENMLFWDVNNGIARRSWARNEAAMFAIEREMDRFPDLRVTMPAIADDRVVDRAVESIA